MAPRAEHFHCYLLRSMDPKHPRKTYVGYTTDPRRRIRQHNGDLKHGGARRTKRAGRPWEFCVVVGGLPTSKRALQFEWAWQHAEKSLAVRRETDNDAALKRLRRQYGVVPQLTILKHVLRCDEWYDPTDDKDDDNPTESSTSASESDADADRNAVCLDLYFTNEKYRQQFLNIDIPITQQVRCHVVDSSLDELPYYVQKMQERTMKKRAVSTTSVPKSTVDDTLKANSAESGTSVSTRSLRCFLCYQSIAEEEHVDCRHCPILLHSSCLDGAKECHGVFSVSCPSCNATIPGRRSHTNLVSWDTDEDDGDDDDYWGSLDAEMSACDNLSQQNMEEEEDSSLDDWQPSVERALDDDTAPAESVVPEARCQSVDTATSSLTIFDLSSPSRFHRDPSSLSVPEDSLQSLDGSTDHIFRSPSTNKEMVVDLISPSPIRPRPHVVDLSQESPM